MRSNDSVSNNGDLPRATGFEIVLDGVDLNCQAITDSFIAKAEPIVTKGGSPIGRILQDKGQAFTAASSTCAADGKIKLGLKRRVVVDRNRCLIEGTTALLQLTLPVMNKSPVDIPRDTVEIDPGVVIEELGSGDERIVVDDGDSRSSRNQDIGSDRLVEHNSKGFGTFALRILEQINRDECTCLAVIKEQSTALRNIVLPGSR